MIAFDNFCAFSPSTRTPTPTQRQPNPDLHPIVFFTFLSIHRFLPQFDAQTDRWPDPSRIIPPSHSFRLSIQWMSGAI